MMIDYFETYLKRIKFDKSLKKLKKKIKDKKVIIYGTGTFFQYTNAHYNLKDLNVIGISDMKYSLNQEGEDDFGYKIIPKGLIAKYKPDYVLVATENYVNIIEDLELRYFKDTNIKVQPLARKAIIDIIKNIWNSI